MASAVTEAAQVTQIAAEVREGLTSVPPSLPCKYFYDETGMALFEQITELPEYYLTPTERGILERNAGAIVQLVHPQELVEIGSGTSPKLRLLLDAMAGAGLLRRCVLLDINPHALAESKRALERSYPGLQTRIVVADFQQSLDGLGPGGGRLICFLGSTIGNLHPHEVSGFLRRLRAHMAAGDALLLGLDLVKDTARLEAAYNDGAGVTARFNLNLLQVMNRRLGASFDLAAFEHVAFYDEQQAWIEMRLRARHSTAVALPPLDLELTFAPGDEVRTEISCKFTRQSLEARLPETGLRLEAWLTDPDQLFALALLRPAD